MPDTFLDEPEVIEQVREQIEQLDNKIQSSSPALYAFLRKHNAEAMRSFDWIPARERVVPALIEQNEDGFTATTPCLAGCIGEGDSTEEARQDFQRALQGLLKAYRAESMPVPWKKLDHLPPPMENVSVFLVPV